MAPTRLTPFLDLHDRAGDTARHRVRGQICFLLDGLIRFAVVVAILGIVTAVAWKTLAPLPSIN